MTTPTTGPEASQSCDISHEFRGEASVNDDIPSSTLLATIADLPILAADGTSHAFRTVYEGPGKHLVVFIRHFFCGNCQEYLRELSTAIPLSALNNQTPAIKLTVIGCGSPERIPAYISASGCPYAIYSDPEYQLFKSLGMTRTMDPGPKPSYQKTSSVQLAVTGAMQVIKSGFKIKKGGEWNQVGGEFLIEDGEWTWCHRMRNTRDHTIPSEIRKHLGLDGGEEAHQAPDITDNGPGIVETEPKPVIASA